MTDTLSNGEKARIMRAALASTADTLPLSALHSRTLSELADELPSLVLATVFDAVAAGLAEHQPKPPVDTRHPLDIPRPHNQRPHGPLFARNKFYGASGCGTPMITDGDTARVICFMNLSGAYGGCDGHAQAMRDATVLSAAYDMLDVLREWYAYGMNNGGDENYSFLPATRAAIQKAGG